MTIRSFLFLSLLLLPAAAWADAALPFLYSRSNIVVMRHSPPLVATLPWQGKPTQAENPAVTFDMEIRDAAMLYNAEGWFDMSGLSERNGVLMAFTAPGVAPIAREQQYAPVDILMVDQEGRITQIIPSIKLAELEQEIMPESEVLAFVFLKGGMCQKYSITPGDTVEYAQLFKKPPTIIGGTKAASAAAQQPAAGSAPPPRPLLAPASMQPAKQAKEEPIPDDPALQLFDTEEKPRLPTPVQYVTPSAAPKDSPIKE